MENVRISNLKEWNERVVKICPFHDKRFVGMAAMFRSKSEMPKNSKHMSREDYEQTIGNCCAFFDKDYPKYSTGVCSAETCARCHLAPNIINEQKSCVEFSMIVEDDCPQMGRWVVQTKDGWDSRLKVNDADFNRLVMRKGVMTPMQRKPAIIK